VTVPTNGSDTSVLQSGGLAVALDENCAPLELVDRHGDKSRHMAIAIYQLSELELLLVARSLKNEQAVKTM